MQNTEGTLASICVSSVAATVLQRETKKNLSAVAAGSTGRSAAWGVGLPTAGGGRESRTEEAGDNPRASPPAHQPLPSR